MNARDNMYYAAIDDTANKSFSLSSRRFFKKSGALAVAFSLAPGLISAQTAPDV
jgi:hypothetical protein